MSTRQKMLMVIVTIIAFGVGFSAMGYTAPEKKHFEDVTIRFFCGGDPGDAFASIVYKGAMDAQSDLGCKVDYVFSGWSMEKMTAQFRDAIAAKPDGIAMMGHPGDDALMSLVAEAREAGILVTFQNVDCPKIRAKYGCGYAGADLSPQGYHLGEYAINCLHLKKGDRALVFGAWGQPGRYIREEGTARALEDAGLIVDRIVAKPEWAADPQMAIPTLTGYVLSHPDVKMIVYSGGQQLGCVPTYMEALDKKPGEIYNIGFDLSPAVIEAFKTGYVQITSDQQPYLQGYLPILNLCLMKKYGMSGLYVDLGAGIVDETNYKIVEDLAKAGIR